MKSKPHPVCQQLSNMMFLISGSSFFTAEVRSFTCFPAINLFASDILKFQEQKTFNKPTKYKLLHWSTQACRVCQDFRTIWLTSITTFLFVWGFSLWRGNLCLFVWGIFPCAFSLELGIHNFKLLTIHLQLG